MPPNSCLLRVLFSSRRADQANAWSNYHKRSNVETTFSMIKEKFGTRLLSKKELAQVNEVLC